MAIHELFVTGKWILNKGALFYPCEGCKDFIPKGEKYWRDSCGLHFCRDCFFAALPGPAECEVFPCDWSPDDCPFQTCSRRGAGGTPAVTL
jgi:hypothetical protein